MTLRTFDQSLPMALMRAREAVMSEFRPILASHGLTEQQWRVLRALAAGDGAQSVGQIADATFLLGPSLSRMLNSLDERNLIERATNRGDGRRVEITISQRGAELVAAISPESEEAYERIESALDPGDLDQLSSLLAQLTDRLDPDGL